jgi:hypothetical protein
MITLYGSHYALKDQKAMHKLSEILIIILFYQIEKIDEKRQYAYKYIHHDGCFRRNLHQGAGTVIDKDYSDEKKANYEHK